MNRTRLAAPLALALAVVGVLAVMLTLGGGPSAAAEAQAAMPFRNTAPLLASDSGQASTLITATPGTTSSPTATATSTSTATATPTTPASVCGSGHASLANFTDPGAASLVRDPQAVTTRFLRTQTRPSLPTTATRSAPLETTVYTVDVKLVSMTQSADHAIHVVVADGETGESFLVSFPGESCIASVGPDDHGQMFNSRTKLRQACGNPPTSGTTNLRGSATITGPGFWGSLTSIGSAVNGVEIGPVLGFDFTDDASCDPTHFVPTPTPTVPANWTYTVGVDVSRLFGVPPGTMAMALVQTYPPVPGLTCSVVYASPPDQNNYIAVDPDPALAPQVTGPDGTATWHWQIPPDSPLGLGRFDTLCGNQGKNVIVYITAAPG
jgi:hypothetical protein